MNPTTRFQIRKVNIHTYQIGFEKNLTATTSTRYGNGLVNHWALVTRLKHCRRRTEHNPTMGSTTQHSVWIYGGRIRSSMGNWILARFVKQGGDPSLMLCVAISPNFDYLLILRIKTKHAKEDKHINLSYPMRMPNCDHCNGFGHWLLNVRASSNQHLGEITSQAHQKNHWWIQI